MQKVSLPEGGGIYFIRIKNYGYVGQTTNYDQRLGAHIRNAYYGRDNNSSQQLYWKMRIHRIGDLEITLYPTSSNYGIPNFENKLNSFLNEWQPVGKRLSHDGAATEEGIRLDFAEIYHILYHFIKHDCVLTNIEVGGQIAGWTSAKRPTTSILNKKGNAVKLVTRQTPPSEAYQTFLRGALDSMNIAEITEQIYKDLFDDNWATIFTKKYLPIASEFSSSREIERLTNEIKNAKLLSWSQFFETKCLKKIEESIPYWVEKSLDKNKITTLSRVRSTAVEDMSEFVSKNFLEPRASLAQKMLDWLFYNSGYTATTIATFGNFDFNRLNEYIGQMVANLIVKIKDKFQITNNKVSKNNQKNFTPIRFSVTWDSRLHKDSSSASWLLDNLEVDKGQQVSENWLKYRSFLLFDYFMDEKHARQSSAAQIPVFSTTLNKMYVPLYNEKHDNWLSTRLHNIYRLYAPGYESQWFNFYRPMISLWRKEHDRPSFDIIKFHEKEYLGYYSSKSDMWILYSVIKNFVNDVSSLSQITIY